MHPRSGNQASRALFLLRPEGRLWVLGTCVDTQSSLSASACMQLMHEEISGAQLPEPSEQRIPPTLALSCTEERVLALQAPGVASLISPRLHVSRCPRCVSHTHPSLTTLLARTTGHSLSFLTPASAHP